MQENNIETISNFIRNNYMDSGANYAGNVDGNKPGFQLIRMMTQFIAPAHTQKKTPQTNGGRKYSSNANSLCSTHTITKIIGRGTIYALIAGASHKLFIACTTNTHINDIPLISLWPTMLSGAVIGIGHQLVKELDRENPSRPKRQ